MSMQVVICPTCKRIKSWVWREKECEFVSICYDCKSRHLKRLIELVETKTKYFCREAVLEIERLEDVLKKDALNKLEDL